MKRIDLLDRLRSLLCKTGFYISEPWTSGAVSFDLVARRDDLLIIFKVLLNVDAMSKPHAFEMRRLAYMFDGYHLLVGLRCGNKEIEEGVIYMRHGVPLMHPGTLEDLFLEGVPPLAYASNGGYFVNLDAGMLRQLRLERGLSLSSLADLVGVSRKAIQLYEDGGGATVDVALRLEEVLGEPVALPLNPFVRPEVCASDEGEGVEEREIFCRLRGLGYTVVHASKCPFDALSRDRYSLLVMGLGRLDPSVPRRARVMGEISRVAEGLSVWVVNDRLGSRRSIEGTVLVEAQEFQGMETSADLLELIHERRERSG